MLIAKMFGIQRFAGVPRPGDPIEVDYFEAALDPLLPTVTLLAASLVSAED